MPATDRQEYLDADLRAGLPTVFVDRHPRGVYVDSVTVDNEQGGYDAARHILSRGHRRIAVLSDLQTIETARLRIAGVTRALHDAGVELDPQLLRPDLRTIDVAEVAGDLGS